MATALCQNAGSSGTLSQQNYYDLLMNTAYHHDIAINSAVKCGRAYTHLMLEDDGLGVGHTDFKPDNFDDDICSYQGYLTNLSCPSLSHISMVFLPKYFLE